MKIIIREKISGINIEVTTKHNDSDQKVKPKISEFQDWVKKDFERQSGYYGHQINLEEGTTNLDLAAAAYSLNDFELVSIDPEIKPNPLPEDAVS